MKDFKGRDTMSMICYLHQVEAAELEALLSSPGQIGDFLKSRSPHYPQNTTDAILASVLKLVHGLPFLPPRYAKKDTLRTKNEIQNTLLDLDKTWHGIHFLLTGSEWEGEEPLCYLLNGGEQIGEIDVGYGPARALRPPQVEAFDAALSAITIEEFRSRFDPARMSEHEIYPDIWHNNPEEDDVLEYLVQYFKELKPFVHQTAQKHQGLVIHLS